MSGAKNACYQCKDRYVGCHSKCDKYAEYQKENAEKKRLIRKEKDLNDLLMGYNPAKKKVSAIHHRGKVKIFESETVNTKKGI